jgi:hypothetical protein
LRDQAAHQAGYNNNGNIGGYPHDGTSIIAVTFFLRFIGFQNFTRITPTVSMFNSMAWASKIITIFLTLQKNPDNLKNCSIRQKFGLILQYLDTGSRGVRDEQLAPYLCSGHRPASKPMPPAWSTCGCYQLLSIGPLAVEYESNLCYIYRSVYSVVVDDPACPVSLCLIFLPPTATKSE